MTGCYIILVGGRRMWTGNLSELWKSGSMWIGQIYQRETARCLYPGLFLEYSDEGNEESAGEWYIRWVMAMHPLCKLSYNATQIGELESEATYEMLVSGGVHDENEVDESGVEYDMEALAEAENEREAQRQAEEAAQAAKEAEQAEEKAREELAKAEQPVAAGTIYSLEELSDFDFLFSNFYTMENNTTITAEDQMCIRDSNSMLAKLRLVEESRQEFVSNVSHELKTPLASMKVLADSLLMQEEAPAELYREFMQDITEEIDRENSIISDLLTLVKMDRKATELNIVVTDVNEFLEQILKRLRPIAEKANIELTFESNRSVSAEIDVTKLSLSLIHI